MPAGLKPTRTPEQAREYMREYRANNREKVRAYGREFNKRKRVTNPEVFMLTNARTRAKKRCEPCTITLSDIAIPQACPILGMPLAVNTGVLGPDSPSLDRRDPALGYVPGNVWVISHRANSMKNDASPAELVLFANAILRLFDEKT